MRYLKNLLLLVVVSLSVVACKDVGVDQGPQNCCGLINSPYTKDTEPMFAKERPVKIPDSFYTNEKGEFSPHSVQIVDMIGQNILVRGNLPVLNGQFAYKELKERIDELLHKKHGRALSPDFLLIDISYLQLGEFSVEHEWFKKNPRFGCYWNRPIIGALISPDKFPKDIRQTYYEMPGMVELNLFVEKVHQLMTANCGRQVVVYGHCHSGRNRTGEFMACYRMKYMGMSYKEVVEANQKLMGNIHDINTNAIKWYALFLREKEGMKSIGKIPGIDDVKKSK